MRATPIVLGLLFLVGCGISAAGLVEPIDHSLSRATPLHFGLYVTPDPATNPINPPERFEGYHAALDYEVSADELEADVPVYAICPGKVLYSGFAEGYGGLLVHRCRIDGQDVTIIYGHLTVEGLPAVKSNVKLGQTIGVLAPAHSTDSDGNRKHLHLGIHKGTELDIRGYVMNEQDLAEFLDPAEVLPTISLKELLPTMQPYWDAGTGSAL